MKYKTIGAFKSVQNIPYCKAAADTKVGMGVILNRVAKTATVPATTDEAKAVTYIVTNINDKPEQRNFEETLKVPAGDFVRADDLRTVNGLEAEFAYSEIKTDSTTLNVGDILVFGIGGLLEKVASATGYATSFKIIAKTAYMNGGVLVEIATAQ